MDNNSMDKQLFDFLNSYNLIQGDLSEEEALERINLALNRMDEDENVLTGFIADNFSNETANPSAYIITDKKRILTGGISNENPEPIEIDEILTISNGTDDENPTVIIDQGEKTLELKAQDSQGADGINDALYSAFGEILDEDRINSIFNISSDTNSGTEIEIGQTESADNSESNDLIAQLDNVPEATVIEESETTESLTPDTIQEADVITADDFNNIQPAVEAPATETIKPKKAGLSKPMIYVLGGVLLVLIAVVAYSGYTYFSNSRATDEKVQQLIGYINSIDEIYNQAQAYMNAGQGGSTTEQWEQLDSSARDIESQLNEFEPNEATDELYQDVYFYNDSLLTAIYYGKSFATTGNPFQQTSLQERMKTTNQNRSTCMLLIDSDFPDYEDEVTNWVDVDDLTDTYPNYDEVQRQLEQANSQPSDLATQNTETSDLYSRNLENSQESREARTSSE